jgi:hypothetical protein
MVLRQVVVITDIGLDAAEFFNEKNQSITDWLYVGISRARHRCVVISTEPMEELLEQQTKSTARIAI